jgi:uncharacterized membrane protein
MRTITTIRRLSLALGLYALISSSVAQRLNWLGTMEVRGVTNSGLVIGKAADNSGAVRTVRVHRRLGSELGGTLGGNHSEAWGITGNGRTVVGFSTLSNGGTESGARDISNVLFAFGTQGTGTSCHEDINWDGIVDDADLLIVLFNFGQGC